MIRKSEDFKGAVITIVNDVKAQTNKAKIVTFDSIITMQPVVFYFERNSYLVHAFNEKIGSLKAGGIFGYLGSLQVFNDSSTRVNLGPKVMTLDKLAGSFEILCAGWLIAALVFLIELFRRRAVRKVNFAPIKMLKVRLEHFIK